MPVTVKDIEEATEHLLRIAGERGPLPSSELLEAAERCTNMTRLAVGEAYRKLRDDRILIWRCDGDIGLEGDCD